MCYKSHKKMRRLLDSHSLVFIAILVPIRDQLLDIKIAIRNNFPPLESQATHYKIFTI